MKKKKNKFEKIVPKKNNHKSLFIALSIVLFLYILLDFYVYLNTPKTPDIPKECQSFDNMFEQENCMDELDSKKYTTPESCDTISEEEVTLRGALRKDRCIMRFVENNPELCKKVIDYDTRDVCFSNIVAPLYGKSWCDFVESDVQRKACIEWSNNNTQN